MNLFYHPNCKPSDSEIIFEKEESRHITKVLRKKEGDVLNITNGKGHFFTATITMIGQKQSRASVSAVEKQSPLPYRLHMAVAPTKNIDRFEWFLEKATEIGIESVTPIICDHSERKIIKRERLERIIESAMKQSLKAYKPTLNPAKTFAEFISTSAQDQLNCIAHCSDLEKKPFKSLIDANTTDVLVLIGPEGDFSLNEIRLAQESGFKGISLGDSRLRTETAAITACHSVSFVTQ